jgi:hypothetical protein
MQKDMPFLTQPALCCFGGFAKLKGVSTDAVRMAREHLRSEDCDLLYPLSDALEEAGYDISLAEHLRDPRIGRHCYGCWVLDAVLQLRPSMVTKKVVQR